VQESERGHWDIAIATLDRDCDVTPALVMPRNWQELLPNAAGPPCSYPAGTRPPLLVFNRNNRIGIWDLSFISTSKPQAQPQESAEPDRAAHHMGMASGDSGSPACFVYGDRLVAAWSVQQRRQRCLAGWRAGLGRCGGRSHGPHAHGTSTLKRDTTDMAIALGTAFARLNAGSSTVKRMFKGSVGIWNADAADWIRRVQANDGAVSTATANAVTDFCNAIDAAGIRDRFYRLNGFCGTGLNACLVPLYRGPSLSGTQYGNATVMRHQCWIYH
jgi:hypothetical protein